MSVRLRDTDEWAAGSGQRAVGSGHEQEYEYEYEYEHEHEYEQEYEHEHEHEHGDGDGDGHEGGATDGFSAMHERRLSRIIAGR